MLNTVFVAAMIAFIPLLLHMFLWGKALNKTVIETSLARYDRLGFPALALLEQPNWSSTGHISPVKKPKCFMGPYAENLPPCQSEADVMSGCSCSSNWRVPLKRLAWAKYAGTRTNTRRDCHLQRAAADRTGFLFFSNIMLPSTSDRAQQAQQDRGELLKPSLGLALWDPRLELSQALELGVAHMQNINANALTEVNLDPQLRQTAAGSDAFVFDHARPGISSVPAQGLQCDTSGDGSSFVDFCQTSIFLQFQAFEVNVVGFRNVMVWTIVAWILSGLALHAG
ncbi:hypothetical protein GE09DRAFT_1184188 [Coniochaeta sp. 2T2.1]|nr:hypothetical protein GE09DRAFT_1184188 [Coniochaeta sp. 2T2.1]